MNDYGLETELRTLKRTTPEQQAAMLEAGVGGERLAEFDRKRTAEEQRLRGQTERAYRLMDSPLQPHGNSTGAQMASLLANALRGFGGLYLANKGEGQLSEAQTASEAEHNRLLDKIKMGRGASKDVQMQGLEGGLGGALRNFGSYDGSI